MLAKFFSAPDESAEVLEERLASFKLAVPAGAHLPARGGRRPRPVPRQRAVELHHRPCVPIDGGYVAL
jgi:hypothetical protein